MNVQNAINVIEAMRLDFNSDARRHDVIREARNVIIQALQEGGEAVEKLSKVDDDGEQDLRG